MKLGEAIEAGYAKHPGKWGHGSIHYVTITDNGIEDRYCAIGLALEGLGFPTKRLAGGGYAPFERAFGVTSDPLFELNDSCNSYEEMMLELKKAGLTELEADI